MCLLRKLFIQIYNFNGEKMKKIILVITFLFVSAAVNTKAAQKHFYLHGFGNDIFSNGAQTTEPLGLWINTQFNDFNDDGKHIQWSSLTVNSFSHQAINTVVPALNLDNSEDHWVGIGYSAGGLVARSASTVRDPLEDKILAYVTIGTPNHGTTWADVQVQRYFVRSYARFGTDIARGKFSFIATLAGNFIQFWLESIMYYVAIYHDGALLLNGPTRNMNPNSSYLSNLNSQSNVNYERQLERGRGIVWGSWNKYCFPAGPLKGMVTSGNDPDIAVQRYQEKIDEAWKENQYHNQMVHNHPGFFQYGKRVWHRSRAGDWSAVRNAYHNIEKDYKLASSHDVNFGSDAFISGNSQRLHSTQFPPLHDPIYSSKDKREQIHGNEIPRVTHGEMVGQLLPNGGKSSAALKRILEKLSYD